MKKLLLLLLMIVPMIGFAQDMTQRREIMVENLSSLTKNSAILSAMSAVPMEFFAPQEVHELVYTNTPISIGYGETISQPSLTAFMIENLNLEKGDKVLELKTASGYQTVLLSYMGMSVTTIESDIILAMHLEKVFNKFNRYYRNNINFKVGNYLYSGWEKDGPYDAIIATAAYEYIPYKIKEQLAPGGVLIAPVGTNSQELLIITKDKYGKLSQKSLLEVRFSMMPN